MRLSNWVSNYRPRPVILSREDWEAILVAGQPPEDEPPPKDRLFDLEFQELQQRSPRHPIVKRVLEKCRIALGL